MFSIGFAASCYRGSSNPGSNSGTANLLCLELHSICQHQAAIALNCVYEHLYFIWIYFWHLLARYVLRYQKSLRELIRVLLMLSTKLDITKHFEVVNEIRGLGMLKKLFM